MCPPNEPLFFPMNLVHKVQAHSVLLLTPKFSDNIAASDGI
jgi:hypothetical protein